VGRRLTRGPDEEEAAVSPLLKLGHDAVHNMRLGRDDVDGVHVPLRRSPLLEALDIWQGQDWRRGRQLGGVLVMLRLRMSSSLTTLSMSFLLSSSTMRIFHCWDVLATRAWGKGGGVAEAAYVATRGGANGAENHWRCCQQAQ
jgi:hypothetical protein